MLLSLLTLLACTLSTLAESIVVPGYPIVSAKSQTTFALSFQVTEPGKVYYVVTPHKSELGAGADGIPTSSQVKQGLDANGFPAPKGWSGSKPAALARALLSVTVSNNVRPNTKYDVHMVAEDGDSFGLSAVVSLSEVTTLDASIVSARIGDKRASGFDLLVTPSHATRVLWVLRDSTRTTASLGEVSQFLRGDYVEGYVKHGSSAADVAYSENTVPVDGLPAASTYAAFVMTADDSLLNPQSVTSLGLVTTSYSSEPCSVAITATSPSGISFSRNCASALPGDNFHFILMRRGEQFPVFATPGAWASVACGGAGDACMAKGTYALGTDHASTLPLSGPVGANGATALDLYHTVSSSGNTLYAAVEGPIAVATEAADEWVADASTALAANGNTSPDKLDVTWALQSTGAGLRMLVLATARGTASFTSGAELVEAKEAFDAAGYGEPAEAADGRPVAYALVDASAGAAALTVHCTADYDVWAATVDDSTTPPSHSAVRAVQHAAGDCTGAVKLTTALPTGLMLSLSVDGTARVAWLAKLAGAPAATCAEVKAAAVDNYETYLLRQLVPLPLPALTGAAGTTASVSLNGGASASNQVLAVTGQEMDASTSYDMYICTGDALWARMAAAPIVATYTTADPTLSVAFSSRLSASFTLGLASTGTGYAYYGVFAASASLPSNSAALVAVVTDPSGGAPPNNDVPAAGIIRLGARGAELLTTIPLTWQAPPAHKLLLALCNDVGSECSPMETHDFDAPSTLGWAAGYPTLPDTDFFSNGDDAVTGTDAGFSVHVRLTGAGKVHLLLLQGGDNGANPPLAHPISSISPLVAPQLLSPAPHANDGSSVSQFDITGLLPCSQYDLYLAISDGAEASFTEIEPYRNVSTLRNMHVAAAANTLALASASFDVSAPASGGLAGKGAWAVLPQGDGAAPRNGLEVYELYQADPTSATRGTVDMPLLDTDYTVSATELLGSTDYVAYFAGGDANYQCFGHLATVTFSTATLAFDHAQVAAVADTSLQLSFQLPARGRVLYAVQPTASATIASFDDVWAAVQGGQSLLNVAVGELELEPGVPVTVQVAALSHSTAYTVFAIPSGGDHVDKGESLRQIATTTAVPAATLALAVPPALVFGSLGAATASVLVRLAQPGVVHAYVVDEDNFPVADPLFLKANGAATTITSQPYEATLILTQDHAKAANLLPNTHYSLVLVVEDGGLGAQFSAPFGPLSFHTTDTSQTVAIGAATVSAGTIAWDITLGSPGTLYAAVMKAGASTESVASGDLLQAFDLLYPSHSGGDLVLIDSYNASATTYTVTAEQLEGDTDYVLYVAAAADPVTAASAFTAVESDAQTTLAASFEANGLTCEDFTPTSMQLLLDMDAGATVLYVLTSDEANVPTAAEIKWWVDHGKVTFDSPVRAKGRHVGSVAATPQQVFVGGLLPHTKYRLYAVAADAAEARLGADPVAAVWQQQCSTHSPVTLTVARVPPLLVRDGSFVVELQLSHSGHVYYNILEQGVSRGAVSGHTDECANFPSYAGAGSVAWGSIAVPTPDTLVSWTLNAPADAAYSVYLCAVDSTKSYYSRVLPPLDVSLRTAASIDVGNYPAIQEAKTVDGYSSLLLHTRMSAVGPGPFGRTDVVIRETAPVAQTLPVTMQEFTALLHSNAADVAWTGSVAYTAVNTVYDLTIGELQPATAYQVITLMSSSNGTHDFFDNDARITTIDVTTPGAITGVSVDGAPVADTPLATDGATPAVLTVQGYGFGSTGPNAVKLGANQDAAGAAAVVGSWTDPLQTFTTQPGAGTIIGLGDVLLETPLGDVVKSKGYSYNGGRVLLVEPSRGPQLGGTQVTITGQSLGDGYDITSVTLGGVAAVLVEQAVNQLVINTGDATPFVWKFLTGSNTFASSTIKGYDVPTLRQYHSGGIVDGNFGDAVGAWVGQLPGTRVVPCGNGCDFVGLILQRPQAVCGIAFGRDQTDTLTDRTDKIWIQATTSASPATGAADVWETLYTSGSASYLPGRNEVATPLGSYKQWTALRFLGPTGMALDEVQISDCPGWSDLVITSTSRGDSVKVASFEYTNPPVIDSVVPIVGPMAGGTSITITGRGMGMNGDVIAVTLNGVNAEIQPGQSDTQIIVKSGNGTLYTGTQHVRVHSRSKGVSELQNAWTYHSGCCWRHPHSYCLGSANEEPACANIVTYIS